MKSTLKTIQPTALKLGEGPIWDDRLQLLYYVDILNKDLYSWDYSTKESQKHIFDEYISCIALTSHPEIILIALESGIYRYDIHQREKSFLCQPENEENYRYNDGKVDWNGNWLLGSMNNINNGPGATLQPDATLYHIEGSDYSTLLDQVTISNGIAFQKPYLYFIDSKINNVRKYKLENTKLEFIEEILSLSDGTTLDGMTISTKNRLYIANWAGAKIIVFDLDTNSIIDSIAVPALNPTSCTFGGPDLNELFITTSQINDDNPTLAGVYSIQLDDQGFPENKVNL